VGAARSVAVGRTPARPAAAAANPIAPAVGEATAVLPAALLRTRVALSVGAIVVVAVARVAISAEHAEADDAGGNARRDPAAACGFGGLDGCRGQSGNERQRQQSMHKLFDHGLLPTSPTRSALSRT